MCDAWENKFAHDFSWKSEIKIPLGRSGSRWRYNIQIDDIELGWEDLDWSHLA